MSHIYGIWLMDIYVLGFEFIVEEVYGKGVALYLAAREFLWEMHLAKH